MARPALEVADPAGSDRRHRLAKQAVVYDLLFRAASETLLTIAADRRHLGARTGLTAVLHTWGSALTHHPYLHVIVPDGGLAPDGLHWIAAGRGSSCRSKCSRRCSAG